MRHTRTTRTARPVWKTVLFILWHLWLVFLITFNLIRDRSNILMMVGTVFLAFLLGWGLCWAFRDLVES